MTCYYCFGLTSVTVPLKGRGIEEAALQDDWLHDLRCIGSCHIYSPMVQEPVSSPLPHCLLISSVNTVIPTANRPEGEQKLENTVEGWRRKAYILAH